jgi:hypothetical protein
MAPLSPPPPPPADIVTTVISLSSGFPEKRVFAYIGSVKGGGCKASSHDSKKLGLLTFSFLATGARLRGPIDCVFEHML